MAVEKSWYADGLCNALLEKYDGIPTGREDYLPDLTLGHLQKKFVEWVFGNGEAPTEYLSYNKPNAPPTTDPALAIDHENDKQRSEESSARAERQSVPEKSSETHRASANNGTSAETFEQEAFH